MKEARFIIGLRVDKGGHSQIRLRKGVGVQ